MGDRTVVTPFLGVALNRGNTDFKMNQEVSGGGPFVTPLIEINTDQTYLGVPFGIEVRRSLGGNWAAHVGVHGALGVLQIDFDAIQGGTAVPIAATSGGSSHFAYRAGGSAGLYYQVVPGFVLGATARVDVGTAAKFEEALFGVDTVKFGTGTSTRIEGGLTGTIYLDTFESFRTLAP